MKRMHLRSQVPRIIAAGLPDIFVWAKRRLRQANLDISTLWDGVGKGTCCAVDVAQALKRLSQLFNGSATTTKHIARTLNTPSRPTFAPLGSEGTDRLR
jgi:hypothetical protein